MITRGRENKEIVHNTFRGNSRAIVLRFGQKFMVPPLLTVLVSLLYLSVAFMSIYQNVSNSRVGNGLKPTLVKEAFNSTLRIWGLSDKCIHYE